MVSLRSRRRTAVLTAFIAIVTLTLGACVDIAGIGSRDLDIMWPRNGAELRGNEVLRARLRGHDLEDYDIYWYVDDGVERRMYDEWRDRPLHKSYEIDTYDWDWNGSGPYTIGFIAEDWRGRQIARREVRVWLD